MKRGERWRGRVKGKRWLLLTRWPHLTPGKRQELGALLALNRRLLKARREMGDTKEEALGRAAPRSSPSEPVAEVRGARPLADESIRPT